MRLLWSTFQVVEHCVVSADCAGEQHPCGGDDTTEERSGPGYTFAPPPGTSPGGCHISA